MGVRGVLVIVFLILAIITFIFAIIEGSGKSALFGAAATVISALLYFFPNNANLPAGRLDYNFHHYYIYENDAADWRDAQRKCNERGGYLAVINDEQENEALFKYMVDQDLDQAFFGLAKTSDGKWEYLYSKYSSDFRDWGYNSIGDKEPNNKDGGEHASLDVYMSNGHWNDAEFGRATYTPEGKKYNCKAAYICEWNHFE